MKSSPILSIPTGGATVKKNIEYYISSRPSFFHAEMQGKAVYIRLKVVGPFPGPAQAGATCTGLPFLKKFLSCLSTQRIPPWLSISL
jgi:hypothetical protein